jgi:hypothetical protein
MLRMNEERKGTWAAKSDEFAEGDEVELRGSMERGIEASKGDRCAEESAIRSSEELPNERVVGVRFVPSLWGAVHVLAKPAPQSWSRARGHDDTARTWHHHR